MILKEGSDVPRPTSPKNEAWCHILSKSKEAAESIYKSKEEENGNSIND